MYNRRTQFIVGGCAVLFASAVLFALMGHTQAEEENQPFVIRKFAFLMTSGSDLAPDYFLSDLSVAVTTVGKPFVTADIMFSPAEEDSGLLAGTEWVSFNTNHTTIGNQSAP